MPRLIQGLIMVGLTAALMASAASAAPIYMDPNPVHLSSLSGTPNAYTLSLLSGDDTTNYRLNFELSSEFVPTAGVAAIFFDDVILTGWGSTSTSDMFFGELSLGDPSAAAWLAIDWWGETGSVEFYVESDQMFTTATVYSLNISFDQSGDKEDWLSYSFDSQRVRFSNSIPEPSAALVFAMGMLIAGRSVSQRRA